MFINLSQAQPEHICDFLVVEAEVRGAKHKHFVIMLIHAALLCTLNEFVQCNALSPIYYGD